jgi:hypothetical protein
MGVDYGGGDHTTAQKIFRTSAGFLQAEVCSYWMCSQQACLRNSTHVVPFASPIAV